MRILTGLQTSGKLHIGNYFGVMLPALQLQDQGNAFYFLADYHAMTSMSDAETLRKNTQDVAIDFLACGLDRAHSYKDKIAKGLDANHALFAYPTLMAADILLYDSEVVPVGKDQKQHLEMTRDLAGKINDRFGEGTLVIPEAQIKESTAIVPGLDGQKMSKSYNNTLPICPPADMTQKQVRKMVMRVKTDSTPVEDPKPTEGSIVIDLYKLFASETEVAQMITDYQAGGFGYGDFKQRLFDAYWDYFATVREKRAELENNLDYVNEVIAKGAETARSEANQVLDRVRSAVGLR